MGLSKDTTFNHGLELIFDSIISHLRDFFSCPLIPNELGAEQEDVLGSLNCIDGGLGGGAEQTGITDLI